MLFSLADCTIDLLFVIVGYLDDKDLAAFASASSFHLLAQHTLRQRGLRQDARSEAAAATTAPFGLGIVDRPRFLSPGERPETVVGVTRQLYLLVPVITKFPCLDPPLSFL